MRLVFHKLIVPRDPLPLNASCQALFDKWKLPPDALLPGQTPLDPPPFEYFSTRNVNEDYIKSPRLAVTKLLTKRWCEAREYYTIYLGSPVVRNAAMTKGTVHHTRLEDLTHKRVDTSKLRAYLRQLAELAPEGNLALVNGAETSYGARWANQIIARLFLLFTTSTAREIMIHGWIDLENGKLCGPDVANAVPVNGVIDLVKLVNQENSRDWSMVEDVINQIDSNNRLIDGLLSQFEIAAKGHGDTKIVVTDVKTRPFSKAPDQPLVVEAAELQTLYYHRMLDTLSRDPQQTYRSLLANAESFGLDVDAPLSYVGLIEMLAKPEGDLLAHDLKLIANGELFGFSDYDNHVFKTDEVYDPSSLVTTPEQLAQICEIHAIEPLLTPLLKPWKRAPTLRFLAARAAQMYHLCYKRMADTTTVEYHNSHTGHRFETQVISVSRNRLDEATAHALEFWRGARPPEYADTVAMCKNCTFAAKCRRPNGATAEDEARLEVGRQLYKYLDDVAAHQKDSST
ncbi:hypothetical protein JNB11_00535 [Kocuria palustris]|nr:hypothetical protein [Kocuria palustris]